PKPHKFADPDKYEPSQQAPTLGLVTAEFHENPWGHPHTNWGQFYAQNPGKFPPPTRVSNLIKEPARVIEHAQKLRAKSVRISIERDDVQTPVQQQGVWKRGNWNDAGLQAYVNTCKQLKAVDIEPIVTLDHFSQPLYFDWLTAKPGSDELQQFVNYACEAIRKLYDAG